MGLVENIHTLNHFINRQMGQSEGKLIVMFIYLKTAFDSLERKILCKVLRDRGVKKGLMKKVEEVYRKM